MFVACAQSMGKKCCKTNCECEQLNLKLLSAMGEIMYSQACPLYHDPIFWAQLQIDIMVTNYPNASWFITYLKDHWLHKVGMWCVGNHNIPHARQNTNVVVESFHSNMKQIFYFSKELFTRCKMDWLIFIFLAMFLLITSMVCNASFLGMWKTKNNKNIIASTMLRAQNIPKSNILLCFDGEDIAFVASINHTPKLWTIHALLYEWPQCDCPFAKQGIACKHTSWRYSKCCTQTFLMVPLLRIWAHST